MSMGYVCECCRELSVVVRERVFARRRFARVQKRMQTSSFHVLASKRILRHVSESVQNRVCAAPRVCLSAAHMMSHLVETCGGNIYVTVNIHTLMMHRYCIGSYVRAHVRGLPKKYSRQSKHVRGGAYRILIHV
jgi:hypothetical protein